MEMWEDKKNFNFPHFCLIESEKVEKWKNKFVKIYLFVLVKNDIQLKQKKCQTTTQQQQQNTREKK